MIKAVLWDFGGVITTSPFEAFNRYEEERAIPKDFIRSVNARNPDRNAWAQLESNAIDLAAFDSLFATETAEAGHMIRGADVLRLLSGRIRPGMVAALKTIKSHYRIACITNNVRDAGSGAGMAASTEVAAEMAQVMAIFDFVIESSVVGLRKPDPAIYTLACEKMAIEPAEAVFLDDLGINLKPARALGMTTIKVASEKQAIDELEKVLSLTLR